ncbi:PLP-dependent aminotransferase family protein [Streptomyces sp. NPDC093589]|uniref:MocR-like pyridoxine biosynthesis transcription factor PdxR n=1 Tax=Streptomyces sp. NPDC093589 TaxID=3366043 RepID=UPI00382EDDC1
MGSGADFLQLNIADAPFGGRSAWLAGELRRAISDGRLPLGSRLPASRSLAADLRVSRGVVTEAYQRLSEDGHVVGRGRSGTVVVAAPVTAAPATVRQPADSARHPGRPPADHPAHRPAPPSADSLFAAAPGPDCYDLLRALPARIDLTPGIPDLASFPRAAWLRAERAVLRDLAAADLGYGDPRGAPALRLAVATWLARHRGIRADPDEVLIVSGTAQAIGLIAQVLRLHGISTVAVEDPGSLGARQHLHHWNVATPPVPVDAEGVRVDALQAGGVPAVLLTPAHQFPTGVVLGGRRRRALMRWAGAGGVVIEDDYDAEHRYDRPPVPALRAMLPEQVWYAGSVSKILAPALRVGWVLAPPQHRDDLVDAKRFADLGNAVLPQLVLARLMASGELERRLRLLRRRHRQRRDAMIEALRAHLPGAVVHGAAAGLYLMATWAPTDPIDRADLTHPGDRADPTHSTDPTHPAALSDAAVAAEALAGGVKVQPLSWHSQRPSRPGLVLGYAARSPSEIADGVATLGALVGLSRLRHTESSV